MQWITEAQATNFLSPNSEWEAFTNKDDLLKLATNRLEQLDFRDEDKDRVGYRYIDGNSVSKVAGSDDFLLEADEGNFAYHEALGWQRSVSSMDLFIYTQPDLTIDNTFLVNDNDGNNYTFIQALTLKQIQNLHTFGATFQGTIALDLNNGGAGSFSMFETIQANSIVDKDGEQVFPSGVKRRITAYFQHNDVYTNLASFESVVGVIFDGVATADVIDEQGNPQTNTAPEIVAGEMFDYKVKIINGLDETMFLYVNDILVANPMFFNSSSAGANRLIYQSGSSGGTNRVSYIKEFGAVINTENPITIPIRLVGACALLALEYGKFPPVNVGDKEYLENEQGYVQLQDLPVNVQGAVEPFLAKYVQPRLLNEQGKPTRKSATSLGYE